MPACGYCICNPHSSSKHCADKKNSPSDTREKSSVRQCNYKNAVLKLRMGHEEGPTWRIRETPEQVSILYKATSGILTAAIELKGFVHQPHLLVCVNLKRLCNTNWTAQVATSWP